MSRNVCELRTRAIERRDEVDFFGSQLLRDGAHLLIHVVLACKTACKTFQVPGVNSVQ
jgi:hypothetical protein